MRVKMMFFVSKSALFGILFVPLHPQTTKCAMGKGGWHKDYGISKLYKKIKESSNERTERTDRTE